MLKIYKTKKDKEKRLKFPNTPNQDLAYLVGVFAGDGSLSYRIEKNEYSLKCVGNPNDEQKYYNKIISRLLKKVFGLNVKMRLMDNNTTFGFRIFSKGLISYLHDQIGLPLGKKYDKLAVPKIFKNDKQLTLAYLRGLFDTDGCICFKKRYTNHPYYPVITFSSKSEAFTKEISQILKKEKFKIVEIYNYKVKDIRTEKGFTQISKIELNGKTNLKLWIEKIGFDHPKNIEKINKYWKER